MPSSRYNPAVQAAAVKRAGAKIFGATHDAKPSNQQPQEIETIGKTRYVLSHLPQPSFTTRPTEQEPTKPLRDLPNRAGRGSDLTEPEQFYSDVD